MLKDILDFIILGGLCIYAYYCPAAALTMTVGYVLIRSIYKAIK